MHEWALAEGIVRTLIYLMKKKNIERIEKVRIAYGELQQIDLDAFKTGLTEMSRNTPLQATNFELFQEDAVFRCLKCGHEWKFADVKSKLDEDVSEAIHFVPELAHSFISCPKCGSSDYEIVKGRGVYIAEVIF
ncbi:MAG: hydrogenase nickel incorporation protein HypA [Candidatus Njordarchaeia archaeon]